MTRPKTSRGGRGRHLNTVGASVVVSAPNMAAGGGGDSSLDGPGAANVDLCGTCNNITGLDAVGCDRCSRWFHPSSMCMGISDALIAGIQSTGGGAVLFACTDCRIHSKRGVGESESAFSQLFLTVKKLCETMQALTKQVAELRARPPVPGCNGDSGMAQPSFSAVAAQSGSLGDASPGSDQLRALIRNETREMEERQKRKKSIIIRGVNAQTSDTLIPVFGEISNFLINSQAALTNITCIDRDKRLFRAKIEDDDVRKQILDNAKKLKNGPFPNVYINRDLTYHQRGELKARRALQRRQLAEGNAALPPTAATTRDAILTPNVPVSSNDAQPSSSFSPINLNE